MERGSRLNRLANLVPVLILAVSAMLLGACEETTAPEEPAGDYKLIVENHSSVTLDEIYFSFCHRDVWDVNRLPAGEVISPNHLASWTLAESGCYDLRAVSTAGAEVTRFDVQINGHYTWKITGG